MLLFGEIYLAKIIPERIKKFSSKGTNQFYRNILDHSHSWPSIKMLVYNVANTLQNKGIFNKISGLVSARQKSVLKMYSVYGSLFIGNNPLLTVSQIRQYCVDSFISGRLRPTSRLHRLPIYYSLGNFIFTSKI